MNSFRVGYLADGGVIIGKTADKVTKLGKISNAVKIAGPALAALSIGFESYNLYKVAKRTKE